MSSAASGIVSETDSGFLETDRLVPPGQLASAGMGCGRLCRPKW
jgi:hypothetical protein